MHQANAPQEVCERSKLMDPLYRADELDAWPRNRGAVCLVGCRPSADCLWQAGRPATTWGSGWRDAWTPHVAGRHVALVPEHNEIGWMFARDLCRRLYGHVASLKWLVLPFEGEGGVRWWFDRGGDLEQLVRLAKATPPLAVGLDWNDKEFERVWTIRPLLKF
jgi:hypothetical protein